MSWNHQETIVSQIFTYDVESRSNYFCAIFYDGKATTVFRIHDANMVSSINLDATHHSGGHKLAHFVSDKDKVLIGFNSFNYDDLLLRYIVANPNATASQINNLSQRIITSEHMPDDLFKSQYATYPWKHSIDVWAITNKKGGLKEWQCRMHFPTVVDAPIDFNAPLPIEKIAETEKYCQHDVFSTWQLYQQHKHLVTLRENIMTEFNVGSRVFVQPDAGVTKTIALASYKANTGGWSSTARDAARLCEDNTRRRWQADELVSKCVRYQTREFKDFETFFRSCNLVGDAQGTTWAYADEAFKQPVELAGVRFQIGVGGLHSVDSPGRFTATDDVGIFDLDVASYYPSLILTLGLYPKHIGPAWLDEFRRIRDERIAAKRESQECAKRIAELEKELANLVE
jgi:hypothetical protein